MKIAISLACLALAACDSTSSMPVSIDAPNPPPPPPPADAAMLTCNPQVPSDCTGETICVGTMCEPAFGRIYHFSQIAVTVAAQNPGGSAWDPFGGAPDPQVVITLNGTDIIKTGVASDTFSATYTDTNDTEIIAGSTLELHVTDSDVGAADEILDCKIDPLGADVLRQIVVGCAGSGQTAGSSITMNIDVKG